MASAVNPLTGSQTTTPSTGSSSSTGLATPTEEMFLKLLVAQIQNQDPLNPTDSTQFVSQLAQISELEQVVGIRSDIENYMGSQASASPTANTTNPGQSTPATTT